MQYRVNGNTKQGIHKMIKTYALATLNANSQMHPLALPLMTLAQAESHAKNLRNLMPSKTVMVINTQAQ